LRAVDIIQKKRDGGTLSPEEIGFFVDGYTAGRVPDYQASALAMAIFFRGMSPQETVSLTRSMMGTGEVLDLSFLPGPKVDKHSTGGVGDKTSLVLAPLAAACGVFVPMISGRGLGHTGGTLDKLESIPGFRVGLSLDEFRTVLRRTGMGLIGQTPQIAPADRKLYSLRDVTGTVESRPLIAASIMSKKMAEGIDALVLDVKTGDGAFMKTFEDSRALAQAMVDIGRGMGKKIVALITGMDEPLGNAVGNALEVREAVETLRGQGPADFEELVLEASARLLALSDLGLGLETARGRARETLADGSALATYRRWISAQGGDPDEDALPRAPVVLNAPAVRDGYVTRLRATAIGLAALRLGAGRRGKDDAIDHAVGIQLTAKEGDRVDAGRTLATIHARDEASAASGVAEFLAAVELGDTAPARRAIVLDVIA